MEKAENRLEEWMGEHGPAVLGLARRMLRDKYAAEDVFQATFIKAYCHTLPFRDGNHTRAWLLRVAANDCRSRMRSPWHRRVSFIDNLSGPRQDNSTTANALQEALRRLKPHYRDVVWMYYYAGYDTNEIAEIAGLPPATVRTRLARARTLLKGMLDRGERFEEI